MYQEKNSTRSKFDFSIPIKVVLTPAIFSCGHQGRVASPSCADPDGYTKKEYEVTKKPVEWPCTVCYKCATGYHKQ